MTIDLTQIPRKEIILRLDDREISISFVPSSQKLIKSVETGWQRLKALSSVEAVESDEDMTKGEAIAIHALSTSLKEADIVKETIENALEKTEWQKLEDIYALLPIDTLTKILVALTDAMSEALIESLAEGKI